MVGCHHERCHSFPEAVIRHADHYGLIDRLVGFKVHLDLPGRDVLAGPNYPVVGPAGDGQPLPIKSAQVAGPEPPVDEHAITLCRF